MSSSSSIPSSKVSGVIPQAGRGGWGPGRGASSLQEHFEYAEHSGSAWSWQLVLTHTHTDTQQRFPLKWGGVSNCSPGILGWGPAATGWSVRGPWSPVSEGPGDTPLSQLVTDSYFFPAASPAPGKRTPSSKSQAAWGGGCSLQKVSPLPSHLS